MFRDFKSGGYQLEDTNVSGNRLTSERRQLTEFAVS